MRLGALKAGRGCGEEGKGAGMIGRLPNGRGAGDLPCMAAPLVGRQKERSGEEERKEGDGG